MHHFFKKFVLLTAVLTEMTMGNSAVAAMPTLEEGNSWSSRLTSATGSFFGNTGNSLGIYDPKTGRLMTPSKVNTEVKRIINAQLKNSAVEITTIGRMNIGTNGKVIVYDIELVVKGTPIKIKGDEFMLDRTPVQLMSRLKEKGSPLDFLIKVKYGTIS